MYYLSNCDLLIQRYYMNKWQQMNKIVLLLIYFHWNSIVLSYSLLFT
jgi:hypothetical protein